MKFNLSDILFKQYNENKLSHVFLIETDDVKKTKEEINVLINQIENNMIDFNNCPGVLYIRSDGKNIKKDDIITLKDVFSYLPSFTKFNYYIIEQAEKMNSAAFNRLLKFMEEPEDHILGFLVTNNKSLMPSTIISRCEFYKNNYNDFLLNNSYNKYVKSYFNFIKNKNIDILWYNENELANLFEEKTGLNNFFVEILNYCMKNCLYGYAQITRKYLERLNYNVNTMLFLNSYAIEMVNYEQGL